VLRDGHGKIRVTEHAIIRARERNADLRTLDYETLVAHICSEVGSAIREHRYAKTAPSVTRGVRRDVRVKSRSGRFVWNETRSRVYFCKWVRGTVLVVSVLRTVNTTA
jgi:hypothetical protein